MAKRDFLDVMKDAMTAIGPAMKNVADDIGAELSRQVTQGSMELASALFGNSAFVQYGPGQRIPTPEAGKGIEAEPHQEQERGSREM